MINKKSRLLVLDYPFVLAFKKIGEDKHSLIGGTIELGESPLEALVREIEEESNIVVGKDDVLELGFRSMLKDSIEHQRYYYQLKDTNQNFKLIETNKFESLEWIDFYISKRTFKKLDQKAIEEVFDAEKISLSNSN